MTLSLLAIAWGHAPDLGQVSLQAQGERVFLVATPPSAVFGFADDDGDGELALEELRAHRRTIQERVQEGVVVRDQQGRPGRTAFFDVLLPWDAAAAAPHVRVLHRLLFPEEVEALSLELSLFAPAQESAEVRFSIRGRSHVTTVRAPRGQASFSGAEVLEQAREEAPAEEAGEVAVARRAGTAEGPEGRGSRGIAVALALALIAVMVGLGWLVRRSD